MLFLLDKSAFASHLVMETLQNAMVSSEMKNRLKVLRAERDWTQADLADRLDISRQAVNAIEKDKYDPSLPLAFAIARLFGMRIEEIFDDEHENG